MLCDGSHDPIAILLAGCATEDDTDTHNLLMCRTCYCSMQLWYNLNYPWHVFVECLNFADPACSLPRPSLYYLISAASIASMRRDVGSSSIEQHSNALRHPTQIQMKLQEPGCQQTNVSGVVGLPDMQCVRLLAQITQSSSTSVHACNLNCIYFLHRDVSTCTLLTA